MRALFVKPVFIFVFVLSLGFTPARVSRSSGYLRRKIVRKAVRFIGNRDRRLYVEGRRFRGDCSGFVRACYYEALEKDIGYFKRNVSGGGVTRLYNIFKTGRLTNGQEPVPGDLIFFHNTYDRNRNQKRDDFFTHAGIVEEVKRDGSVTYIHRVRNGVRRYVINMNNPRLYKKDGKKINDYLRRRPSGDPNRHRYLGSAMFACYVNVLGVLFPDRANAD